MPMRMINAKEGGKKRSKIETNFSNSNGLKEKNSSLTNSKTKAVTVTCLPKFG